MLNRCMRNENTCPNKGAQFGMQDSEKQKTISNDSSALMAATENHNSNDSNVLRDEALQQDNAIDEVETSTHLMKDKRTIEKQLLPFDLCIRTKSNTYHTNNQYASTTMMLLPPCLANDRLGTILRSSTIHPPTTRTTLSELDLQWIQNNINLRIGINYDGCLHFVPISGQKAREKRALAANYWFCLATELRVYQHNNQGSCRYCEEVKSSNSIAFLPRLPTLFEELKALLSTLVPPKDLDQLLSSLNTDFLMQQVTHGVLDIVSLSRRLQSFLTQHCAPVRDIMAEEMCQMIDEASRANDMNFLVKGLEKLFSLLEAMKLDNANHNVRTYRAALIDDGIAFQRDYFTKQLQAGRLDLTDARDWFRRCCSTIMGCGKLNPSGSDVLVYGFVQLCVSNNFDLPSTLKHDMSRFYQLREEMQDNVYLTLCLNTFDSYIRQLQGSYANIQLVHEALRCRIIDLTDGDEDNNCEINDIWYNHVDVISVEITRAIFDTSSQQNRHISNEAFRSVQSQIRNAFMEERESRRQTQNTGHRLIQNTLRFVEEFQAMSTLSIAELQKQYQESRKTSSHSKLVPDLDDISRRLAHMVIIHWRVWNDIAYC